jgi:hypothetical protein
MPNSETRGFLSLRELLFGRKIGVLKEKREARHANQGSDRPDAAAPAAPLEQAPPTINRIASRREISDVILMRVLPFADKHMSADVRGSMQLLGLARSEGGVAAKSLRFAEDRVSFSSVQQQNWSNKWQAKINTLTLL